MGTFLEHIDAQMDAMNDIAGGPKCKQCGVGEVTIHDFGTNLCAKCLYKPQPDDRAKYRMAIDAASRDGVVAILHDEDHSIESDCHYAGCGDCIEATCSVKNIRLSMDVHLAPDPSNWYDQALQLVARVHRLRELLRQAGETI